MSAARPSGAAATGAIAEAAETASPTPVIAVESLSIAYRTGRGRAAGYAPAVRDVSFDVFPGETVAIVGGSGSGKSTTAHAIVGLLPRAAKVLGGRVLVAGEDVLALPEKRLARIRGAVVGLVPQDPTLSLDPVQPVGAQIAEALVVHKLAHGKVARAEALRILALVGIDRPEQRYGQFPHQLSGGQRQRVLIGIAIACGPRAVIADEATSGLDVTVQKRVLDQLSELARERGTAVVLITHDLGVAADRADRIVVLEHGRVVEQGPTARILETPAHPYTRALFAAAPSIAARIETRDRRSAPGDSTADRVTGEGESGTDAGAPSAAAFLAVRGLRREFVLRSGTGRPQTITAVDDLSFDLERGSTFALVGESGSGKSTTARLVNGFDTPTSGSVVLDGTEVTTLGREGRRQLRRRVQFVHQNPYAALDPRFTIEQILTEPLRSFDIGGRAERRDRAAELLELVHLPADHLGRRPGALSGGQRQRIAIARALALDPELIVLDEPVSALDVVVQKQVLELLAEVQRRLGLSYLFISHDLAVVRLVADRVGVLRHGVLQELGDVDAVFDEPRSDYTRELLAAIPGRAVG